MRRIHEPKKRTADPPVGLAHLPRQIDGNNKSHGPNQYASNHHRLVGPVHVQYATTMPPKSRKRATIFGKSAVSLVFVLWVTMFCSPDVGLAQSDYSVRSPDQRIELRIRTSDRLTYDVLFKGAAILQNSTLSMKIHGITIGRE